MIISSSNSISSCIVVLILMLLNFLGKPGRCPPIPSGPPLLPLTGPDMLESSCMERCFSDFDCEGRDKCCGNPCGHECKKPVWTLAMENVFIVFIYLFIYYYYYLWVFNLQVISVICANKVLIMKIVLSLFGINFNIFLTCNTELC